ncbi:cytochrome P450 [Alkalihalobacillus sp. BA299]|uniref:cytochrome P450 n=1 Tax=Alkalihalobacillus sp. BA299 TaxID=2815938 RepID=UPI001ADB321E|nr:cytochrome P450 [Alkalihalobacillus sp. BA299]
MTSELKQALHVKKTEQTIPSSDFLSNPYPTYDKLREKNPVYKGNLYKQPGWYITGYEEAVAVLKNTKFKNRIPLPESSKKYEQLKNIQNDMMLFKNQADHKRLRMLVSKGITPSMIESYRLYMEEVVHELLNQVQNKGKMDVVMDFSYPLASHVIAKLLGVPIEDRQQFRDWALSLVPTIDFTRSRKTLENGNEQTKKLLIYFKKLIQNRKQAPQQDLISQLILEEQQGIKLTDDELLATCILLVIAGHETTVNLISNSILSLLSNPEQLAMLKENPSLIERAVEEFLRFESPTQMTARIASEDIEINGTRIKKDEHVYILLGAANRDPKIFINPNVLDITRSPNPHLAFGYGTHFCIGSTLARLEAQVAIQTILQQLDHLQMGTPDPQWRNLIGFRSLKELPLTFKAVSKTNSVLGNEF